MPRSRTPTPVAQEQPSLLPAERPEGRFALVETTNCHANIATTPPADLVESVRRLGVLQPIVMVQEQAGVRRFRVVAGRRRLAAARAVGMTAVPAFVFPPGTRTEVAAAMTLTENTLRGPNPLTDLLAVDAMVHAGATIEQIAQELHIPIQTVRQRLGLSNLIAPARVALEEGRMSAGTAVTMARMPADEQQRVLALAGAGRVQIRHVREVRQVEARTQVEALPDAAFAPPPTVTTNTAAATVDAATAVVQAGGQTLAIAIADAPEHAGWVTVLACLRGAQGAIPVDASDDSDAMYTMIEEVIRRAEPLAGVRPPAPRRRTRAQG